MGIFHHDIFDRDGSQVGFECRELLDFVIAQGTK